MNSVTKAFLGEKKGVTSFTLRIIAIVAFFFVLLYENGFGKPWMQTMRWVAYPIILFLLAEGVEHSSSQVLYLRRLAIFALISEIAYNFMTVQRFFSLYSRSSMATLLIAYLVLVGIKLVREKFDNMVVTLLAILLFTFIGYKLGALLNCAFYQYGIIMAVVFYISGHSSYPGLLQLICYLIMVLSLMGTSVLTIMINGLQYEIPAKAFAIFALIPIWLYKGDRGPNTLPFRLSFYIVYPLMLVAFGIAKLIVY